MSEETETKTFLTSVPIPIEEKLSEEAKRERRSRNAQLTRILEERYGFAPASTQQEPAAA